MTGLTPKQEEVLQTYIREPNRTRAELFLGITPKTFDKHLEAIRRVFGVRTTHEAIILALRTGVATLD